MHVIRVVVLVLVGCVVVQCSRVSVKTKLGEIIGERTNAAFQDNTYEVDRYLGIPFAKPPVGDLRFKKPEPVEPFDQPYEATKWGDACPQFDYLSKGPVDFGQSEDCLFLNVYVPNQEPDQATGHAVMFFIHGGGFALGTGNVYRGEVLSSFGNVIVVTINYRLGLLGFLDLDDDDVAGNYGLWDQHQALKWVNENIESFGGDKDRVTIFGESAGSVSVTLQMLFPQNKGLFKNAIAESGTVAMPFVLPENLIPTAMSYANGANCSTESNEDLMKCFRAMTADQPIEILKDAIMNGGPSAQFGFFTVPTLDGEFSKRGLAELEKAARTERIDEVEFCRSINLMNGVNEAEGALFLMMIATPENPLEDLKVTREAMDTQHIPQGFGFSFGFGRAIPETVKDMLVAEYTDWTSPNDPIKLRDQVIRLTGDVYFNVPGVAFSLLHSNASDVVSYMYKFSAVVDRPLLDSPDWFQKANHGDELGPVFGYNFDSVIVYNITDYKAPDWELDLSSRVMAYWTNFAKTGDPNTPTASTQSAGPWPKYTVDEQRYMVLDREESTGQFLFTRETNFWRNILPRVLELEEQELSRQSKYSEDQQGSCDKEGDCGGD